MDEDGEALWGVQSPPWSGELAVHCSQTVDVRCDDGCER